MRTVTLNRSGSKVVTFTAQEGECGKVTLIHVSLTEDENSVVQQTIELGSLEEIRRLRDFLNACIEFRPTDDDSYESFPNSVHVH